MTLDKVQIENRLEKLGVYYQRLLEYRQKALKNYDDQMLIDAVERNLQLAIEAMLDIGEILIATLKLEKPQIHREVPLILAKEKIIPSALSKKLALAAGFKNILIHDYLAIDNDKVLKYLQEDLEDFNDFARHIAEYLTKL